MARSKVFLLSALLLVATAVCAAFAQGVPSPPPVASYSGPEEILEFASRITVNPDGAMLVREAIKVRAAQNQIRHGIYRDFPTRYSSFLGPQQMVGFEVTEALRDDRPEQFRTVSQSNGERVYLGDPSAYVEPGVHTYILTYKTDHQLGFFEDHDELYWNATGNGWVFPIRHANATVILPNGVPAEKIKVEGYTGSQGSKEQNYTAGVDKDGYARFATTRGLGPGEGMTIVVSWPKGFVKASTSLSRFFYLLEMNKNLIFLLLGFVLVFAYYFTAWSRVGKDPPKGTIIPIYEPPAGLSPAAVRYVRRMGYDNRAFAAAVVNMAVKGYLHIDQTGKSYTLIRGQADESVLSPEEASIANRLLGAEQSYVIDRADHSHLLSTIGAVASSLTKSYQKQNFTKNSGYLALGILGSLCALAVPLIAGGLSGLPVESLIASPLMVVAILLFAAMAIVFGKLLPAPTVPGRALLDQIDGFQLYLSVAEGDQLRAMAGVNKTPELFEKYLPYAMALGVEKAWAGQFADLLARSETGYTPTWYTGTAFNAAHLGGFTSSLGSSLSSTISSSSTPPGSSSGGGGGGSSGGGGGGGGGGGW